MFVISKWVDVSISLSIFKSTRGRIVLDDEVVPLLNTINLQTQMPNNLEKRFDINHYGSHMETSIVFMKYMYQDL